MVLVKKLKYLHFLLFKKNGPHKNIFVISRYNTSHLTLWKQRFKKSGKFWFFPKALTHDFWSKFQITSFFISYANKGELVDRKLAISDHKNIDLKNSKIFHFSFFLVRNKKFGLFFFFSKIGLKKKILHFSKGVGPCFLMKIVNFVLFSAKETRSTMDSYYKLRQLFYTKCDTVYCKLRQVLQSAMIITNCDSTGC